MTSGGSEYQPGDTQGWDPVEESFGVSLGHDLKLRFKDTDVNLKNLPTKLTSFMTREVRNKLHCLGFSQIDCF